MLYIGLDYHTKHSYVSILDENGQEVLVEQVETTRELPDLLRDLPDSAKVLFEAGYGWPRLVKILKTGLARPKPRVSPWWRLGNQRSVLDKPD